MNKSRGYCLSCNKRTTHKEGNIFICLGCKDEMGLEDEVLSQEEEKILKLVSKKNLSARELGILLKQPTKSNVSNRTYNHSKEGHVRIGIISDTHIGHEAFDEGMLKHAGETFRKRKIKDVYHAGDILEGMSGRDGHIYELAQVGFTNQINYATDLFKKYFKGFNIYGITGNHDQWYKKKNNGGVCIGTELDHRLDNFTFLGEDEADIKLGKGVVMKLFHPGDGSAYATSYKMQKLIESLEGGKKPQIVVEGHYHKALYMFIRNVHAIEAGTFCGQSQFMRLKKLPAHKGYWTLDFDIDKKGGVKNFTPTFFPFYN